MKEIPQPALFCFGLVGCIWDEEDLVKQRVIKMVLGLAYRSPVYVTGCFIFLTPFAFRSMKVTAGH